MATMEAIEGKTDERPSNCRMFRRSTRLSAFAGPLFSFCWRSPFALVVWQVGKPASVVDGEPVLGWVCQPVRPRSRVCSPATKLEIDDKPVTAFGPPSQDSITWRVITSKGN